MVCAILLQRVNDSVALPRVWSGVCRNGVVAKPDGHVDLRLVNGLKLSKTTINAYVRWHIEHTATYHQLRLVAVSAIQPNLLCKEVVRRELRLPAQVGTHVCELREKLRIDTEEGPDQRDQHGTRAANSEEAEVPECP